MRQYELAIRIAQIHHLVDERKYKKALAVIQTLDMRQVRSLSDLKTFAEVYTKTEQYEAAKATYLRIYRRSKTRRVLYRLIYLSIRTNALDDAEAYYQEFIHMNPNARDALILRYRIDKAAGVPIGQLIEILQELKQEEYIEEWAYELAKLYHRAGRREECLEECEDIVLWFGTGEIVERAKILIDHLKEKDPIPYYDDKDFTVPKKEEPNPDDTGSLPDINEFIKERKEQKKEERRIERENRREEAGEEEFEDDFDEAEHSLKEEENQQEKIKQTADEEEKAQKESLKKETSDDTFIDDYEEDDFEQDGIDFSQKAKDGIQKLSGLLKFGKKEEEDEPAGGKEQEKAERQEKTENDTLTQEKPKYVPHSQSGTGITQDLAKEISAIYELEHREQLKEKAVTVINEVPNIATNVVDRMTQAIQKSADRSYIPLDIEEIRSRQENTTEDEKEEVKDELKQTEDEEEEVKDELMQALDEEVEEYYAKMNQTVSDEASEAASEAVDEQEKDAEGDGEAENEQKEEIEEKSEYVEEQMEEITSQKKESELLKDLLEEEIHDPQNEEEQEKAQQDEQQQAEQQQEKMQQEAASALENYHAPEIPVVETDYMEMPEITYEDLPTTRALQQSFKNVLKLIGGELDPSHFVLLGDGDERVVGVSKQIVRVMKESGYLSKGRIAKICASQLNTMDLITFRSQLKGNCLLVEEASDLLFPTITKIFSIMEEYYGDFVVILADEGATLDQLFRFVPVLAAKFKYIIDISKYTEKDYTEVGE